MRPTLDGVEYEIGQVINMTFYPLGPEGPVYPTEVRIVAWEESAKTMRFESLDGTISLSIQVPE